MNPIYMWNNVRKNNFKTHQDVLTTTMDAITSAPMVRRVPLVRVGRATSLDRTESRVKVVKQNCLDKFLFVILY